MYVFCMKITCFKYAFCMLVMYHVMTYLVMSRVGDIEQPYSKCLGSLKTKLYALLVTYFCVVWIFSSVNISCTYQQF